MLTRVQEINHVIKSSSFVSPFLFFKILHINNKTRHFKVNRSVAFRTSTVLGIQHLSPVPEHCHHPQKETGHPSSSLSRYSSLSLWEPLICSPSLWLRLFCTFPPNGVLLLVAFCIWLLSLNLRLSRWGGARHRYLMIPPQCPAPLVSKELLAPILPEVTSVPSMQVSQCSVQTRKKVSKNWVVTPCSRRAGGFPMGPPLSPPTPLLPAELTSPSWMSALPHAPPRKD